MLDNSIFYNILYTMNSNYDTPIIRERSVAALRRAIEIIGTAHKLALLLGGANTLVGSWLHKTKYGVAGHYVRPIEELTDGQVKRHDLRCDLFPEGDHYFLAIKNIASKVIEKYILTTIARFFETPACFIAEVINYLNETIYDSILVKNNELMSHHILAISTHACAYKYAVLQHASPMFGDIFPHTEIIKVFFAAQADVIDEIYSQLEEKDG